MSALPLLDIYLGLAAKSSTRSAQATERLRQIAERLVQSALNRHRELEGLDTCEPDAPAEPTEVHWQAAALIRGMYDEWVREAEAILERVAQIERGGAAVQGAKDLGHQVGRVRAMLSVSLRDIEEGLQQLKDGRSYTKEEVRRELRLGA